MLVVYPTVGRLVPQRLKEWTEAMLPVVSDDGPDGGVEMQSPTPLQAATHAASSAPASPNLCRRAATSTSGGSGGGLQVVTPAPQQSCRCPRSSARRRRRSVYFPTLTAPKSCATSRRRSLYATGRSATRPSSTAAPYAPR